jgi:hypothetical protein
MTTPAPSKIADLISRARLELGDQSRAIRASLQTDGVTALVYLPQKPIDVTTLTIISSVSGPLVSGTDYTADGRSGTITLMGAAATVPATLTVSAAAYRFFTDDDWTTFVNTALLQHLHGTTVDLAQLPAVEEYPIALLACVQGLWALLNDAAFDIDIATPEGVSIPRHQRYSQLQQMLASRQDQYNKICAALNVGLNRIEMFELRRKSMTTEKLVPLYIPQEFNDSRPPYQVFPQIDVLDTSGRTEPVLTPAQTLDIVTYAFQNFSQRITGLGNLTGKTVHASVRAYPAAYQPLAYMKVDVIDAVNGIVNVSLDSTVTYYLGMAKFWDLQTIDSNIGRVTLVQGRFDAIRQGNG